MIKITKGPAPNVLVVNGAAWTREYVALDAKGRRDFRKYAHPDIKEALRAEANSKCTYCESFIDHIDYGHIDHIKPKSKFPDLVVEWGNLVL